MKNKKANCPKFCITKPYHRFITKWTNLALIGLLLLGCKKESTNIPVIANNDSLSVTTQPKVQDSAAEKDSINNAQVVKKVLQEGIMREKEAGKIIRITDASQLPFKIGDAFSNADQTLLLKIKDFSEDQISVLVQPENKNMNIRIQQIIDAKGNTDGPFGKSVDHYVIKNKGEIQLLIGKSNMASGDATGNFTISVE